MEQIVYHIQTTSWVILYVGGPPLAAAAIFGFVVALFQGVTQIQDQSLPQIVKIFAVGATLFFFGGILFSYLIEHARVILDTFPEITR